MLYGKFIRSIYEEIREENFDLILTAQLHANDIQKFKNSTSTLVSIDIVLNEITLMDRFKPQNTTLIAMWCSNVPLTRPSLQFVYHPVSVQYNRMRIVSDYFRIAKKRIS